MGLIEIIANDRLGRKGTRLLKPTLSNLELTLIIQSESSAVQRIQLEI